MKKTITIFLVFILSLTFIGCTSHAERTAVSSDTSQSQETDTDVDVENETEESETGYAWSEYTTPLYYYDEEALDQEEKTIDIVMFNQIVYQDHDVTIYLESLEFAPVMGYDMYESAPDEGIKLNYHVVNASNKDIVIKQNYLAMNSFEMSGQYLISADAVNESEIYDSDNEPFYVDAQSNQNMYYCLRRNSRICTNDLESAYIYLSMYDDMLRTLDIELSIYDYKTGYLLGSNRSELSLKYDMNRLSGFRDAKETWKVSDTAQIVYENDECRIIFCGFVSYATKGSYPDELFYIENKSAHNITITYGNIVYNDTDAIENGITNSIAVPQGLNRLVQFSTSSTCNDSDAELLLEKYPESSDGMMENLESVTMNLYFNETSTTVAIRLPVYLEEIWSYTTAKGIYDFTIYR
jgi:hypothetical protein